VTLTFVAVTPKIIVEKDGMLTIRKDMPANDKPIQILHLEDSRIDAELIAATLVADSMACEITRVETGDQFEAALRRGGFNVILSDYSLPTFDGSAALTMAKNLCPEIPFIFISGTIGEEVAIETIKRGATDYVLKQRLARLVFSIQRALKETRERTDRKKLESIVLQSDKMASMGQLAAGVAHELNNPLTGILGYAQLLRESSGLSERQQKDVQAIEAQSLRCREIIQTMLLFGRKKEIKKEIIQLGPLVDSVLRLVHHDLQIAHIKIIKTIPDSLPPIFGDFEQLQQVCVNLIINSKHALKGRPNPCLTIEAIHQGPQIFLSFKDNGCGISNENLGKIFDLFFTTKPIGQGTGLGLSISYRIIEQIGGMIDVESQEGIGTTFTLQLPHYEDGAKKPMAEGISIQP